MSVAKLSRFVFFLAITIACFTALAETTPGNTNSAPQRGENMVSVQNRLGAPLEKVAPVGKPPIERWVYRDFTVYFEGNYVIHSVANEIKPQKK